MSKGFTIIESLVASLIICAIAASSVLLIGSGIRHSSYSRQAVKSLLLSKSMIEELRGLPYDMLYMFNNMKFDGDAGTIIIRPDGNDMTSITIRHKVELSTKRSKY